MRCRAAVANTADAGEDMQQYVLALGHILKPVQLQSHQRCENVMVVLLLALRTAEMVGYMLAGSSRVLQASKVLAGLGSVSQYPLTGRRLGEGFPLKLAHVSFSKGARRRCWHPSQIGSVAARLGGHLNFLGTQSYVCCIATVTPQARICRKPSWFGLIG